LDHVPNRSWVEDVPRNDAEILVIDVELGWIARQRYDVVAPLERLRKDCSARRTGCSEDGYVHCLLLLVVVPKAIW
jgi:hypothetical protein